MVRVYGRCRRGERLVCKTPWGHWKTTTFTCGLRCDGVVVARMLSGQGNFGFDAARKEYVDLVEAGIVDPAKVVRTALENAVSVAT